MELLVSAVATLINHQPEPPIPSGAQGGTLKYRTNVPGISRRNLYFGLGYLLSLFTTKKFSFLYWSEEKLFSLICRWSLALMGFHILTCFMMKIKILIFSQTQVPRLRPQNRHLPPLKRQQN